MMTQFVRPHAQYWTYSTTSAPQRLAYAEEYAKLESLLTQLAEIPINTLKTAMVDGWITELRRRVDAFNELRKTKTQTRSEIETGATPKARIALIDAYRTKCLLMLSNVSIL